MKVVETHGHHFNNVVDAVGKAAFVVGQVQAVTSMAHKYRRELEKITRRITRGTRICTYNSTILMHVHDQKIRVI